jgi:hypothetical protein
MQETTEQIMSSEIKQHFIVFYPSDYKSEYLSVMKKADKASDKTLHVIVSDEEQEIGESHCCILVVAYNYSIATAGWFSVTEYPSALIADMSTSELVITRFDGSKDSVLEASDMIEFERQFLTGELSGQFKSGPAKYLESDPIKELVAQDFMEKVSLSFCTKAYHHRTQNHHHTTAYSRKHTHPQHKH